MADPSEVVFIDDLLDPVLPPEIVEAMDAVKPMDEALDWSVDSVLSQAAAETGLDDFGDDIHLEPLGVLVEVMSPGGDGMLSILGRLSNFAGLVTSARNKLLVADLLKRHPEIHEIEIARPIVIAGQGRTGTTHLQNLMSTDPGLRSMPYWESLEPIPPLAEQGIDWGPDVTADPRYQRCVDSLATLNATLPHFRRMHDMYPAHVHEEIQLAAIAYGGQLPETMVTSPTFRDWYLASDQTPYYEFTKTVLKVMTFLRGGERWLLKSPQHTEQIGPLLSVFSDATVVCTHRDPVAVTQSLVTMMCYTGRMSREPSRLRDVGLYWVDRAERMCRGMVDQHGLLPDDRSIDVLFHEFMADDIAMVKRIYALADQPFTDKVETGMHTFMSEHPRGVHGRLRYDLSPFGVDRDERREALRFYTDRFPVELEGD